MKLTSPLGESAFGARAVDIGPSRFDDQALVLGSQVPRDLGSTCVAGPDEVTTSELAAGATSNLCRIVIAPFRDFGSVASTDADGEIS
jgi:hypothetical protein